jgi:hypothetical protein
VVCHSTFHIGFRSGVTRCAITPCTKPEFYCILAKLL